MASLEHRPRRWCRLVVALALLLAVGIVATASTDASAQQSRRAPKPTASDPAELAAAMPQPTACSRGYQQALATIARTLPGAFAATKATLRSPIPDLDARWLFAESKPPLDWATLNTAKGRPAANGDRLQRLLEVYRRAGGVAPEATSDGKYYWALERVAADLTTYVAQPESANICSGAPEMLDFITEQIAQPTRRAAAVKDVTKAAGETALRAVDALPTGDRPRSSPIASDPAALLMHTVGITLPAPSAAAIAAEPALNARLRLAAAAVKALPPAEAVAVRPAYAAIEIFAFATQMAERYGHYDRSFTGTIETVRSAHRRHCTCAE